MAEFRSSYRSYGGDRKLEIVNGKAFSANQIYVSRSRSPDPPPIPSRVTKTSTENSASTKKWSFNDPEMKRRKRVVRYKMHAIEGKVKASFKKGFRWIKNKCSEIVHSF